MDFNTGFTERRRAFRERRSRRLKKMGEEVGSNGKEKPLTTKNKLATDHGNDHRGSVVGSIE